MVEEEGLITRFASATDFDVAGEKVTTTASTVFKNGTAADLALNVRVEVRGTLDANKVLVADVVEIERVAVIGLAATVSAVTTNTLTVLGVTISVDTNTRLEDVSNAHVHMFSLTDVKVRSEEHTSELQSQSNLVCRLLLEKKNTIDRAVLHST